MRLRLVGLVFGCVALLAGVHHSFAQSAYDYPWCAVYSKTNGAMSCYYTSFQQCITTMRGIGGTCVRSPYQGARPRWDPRLGRY